MRELSPTEDEKLECYESTITRGLETFVEVGSALLAIRDEGLYQKSHNTFEDYCRERWNLKRQRAYELMEAAQVVGNLSEISDKPTRESHVAPLASLSPDLQREAWQLAVETAPNGKVTAKHVEDVAAKLKEPSAPRTLPGQGELFDSGEDGEEEEIWLFTCPVCDEQFHVEVWHCPKCLHHWEIGDDECRNCHDFERLEDGTVRKIVREASEFDEEDEDQDRDEPPGSGPESSSPEPSSSATSSAKRPLNPPVVNLGSGPTFAPSPGQRSTACFDRWAKTLNDITNRMNNIILEIREHGGIGGSVQGLTDRERTFILAHFERFQGFLSGWIRHLKEES
jgi:hypothetical protein